MANDLLEQAQMEFANKNIAPSTPMNVVESVVDAGIEQRLAELLTI